MLTKGFDWNGQRIQTVAVLTVQGGIGVSPNSSAWSPWWIARFNTDDETLAYWKGQIDSGARTMYTSDGNPGLITIPEVLPEDVAEQFDPAVIAGKGRSLVRYNAEPADETTGRLHQGDMAALVRMETSARSSRGFGHPGIADLAARTSGMRQQESDKPHPVGPDAGGPAVPARHLPGRNLALRSRCAFSPNSPG
jgi:hypothetical protein